MVIFVFRHYCIRIIEVHVRIEFELVSEIWVSRKQNFQWNLFWLALNLKNIEYTTHAVNLLKGETVRSRNEKC